MKGFIIKDLLSLRQIVLTTLLLGGFYVALGLMGTLGGGSAVNYFPMMAMIVCMMVPLNCAGTDEQCDWDSFGKALPVSRSRIVLARYGVNLIALVVGGALAVISAVVFHVAFHTPFRLAECVIPMVIALLYMAVCTPVIYKFGVNKARIVMIALMVLPMIVFAGLIGSLMMFGEEVTPSDLVTSASDAESVDIDIALQSLLEAWKIPLVCGGIVIALAIFALSCLLSIHIYKNKN